MDAIVLAGGAGRRLGGPDKPDRLVGAATLLERVVGAVRTAGTVVIVGPERRTPVDVRWCVEQPPGGGPVAGIAAGLQLTSDPVVLVLAADLPWIAGAIPQLVDAVRTAACAVLVDPNGRRNPLAAAWRRPALERALAAVGEPAGARALGLLDSVDPHELAEIADAAGWGEDCDTPEDLSRARERARSTERTP